MIVTRQSGQCDIAYNLNKRVLDCFLASLALIFFSPFLVLIAVAVKFESQGPAIFRQVRTGLNGRPFLILKFRTMWTTAATNDLRQARLGDSRVTRIGRFLRRTSLDELPQLINVVRGDMSLVGPRPHAVGHDQAWAELIPTYHHRFRVKPGLTGLAQVAGLRGEILNIDCLERRISADNRYIDQWSFGGDVAILVRTVFTVSGDPAAY